MGYDENRLYGKAQVEIAWMEKFVEEQGIEKKWEEFRKERRRADAVPFAVL